MSLIQFVQSRVHQGRMQPVAKHRVNKLVRTMDNGLRLHLCAPRDWAGSNSTGKLKSRELDFRDACCHVNLHHRHHASPLGHLFSGGVFQDNTLRAAVIVGRPVARALDDGKTVEITRVASDGTRNACSKAMAWAIAEARNRGFKKVISYTLATESGGSLKAVGFELDATTRGGSWNCPSRPRAADRHPTTPKTRWVKTL